MSIQGQILDITVVGCYKLKDTEWLSRQDPYVCVEYIGNRFRTRTCTDGGKNPVFQEKFRVTMVEGARELKISVWNSNTMTTDDFIGSGTVSLQNVLAQGFEDSSWTLQTKTGRHAGEVRLILHFANAKKPEKFGHPSAPPQVQMYSAPLVTSPYAPPASAPYAPPAYYQAPPQYTSYPSQHSAYPPQPSAYPPQPSAYPPQPSPYPPQPSAYPPPPSAYPPPPSSYPPPPSNYPPSQCYNQGLYPGTYPPPY